MLSWISSCGRQSVDQFVLVSGSPLGPMTRFYLSLFFLFDNYFVVLPRAPSLTRGRVCSLQCNRWLIRSLTTNNYTLPSHLRLRSLFIASYDSKGLRWRYSNPPPRGDMLSAVTPPLLSLENSYLNTPSSGVSNVGCVRLSPFGTSTGCWTMMSVRQSV
jgi:hypothetical protein